MIQAAKVQKKAIIHNLIKKPFASRAYAKVNFGVSGKLSIFAPLSIKRMKNNNLQQSSSSCLLFSGREIGVRPTAPLLIANCSLSIEFTPPLKIS
jgi:hypothetical protein